MAKGDGQGVGGGVKPRMLNEKELEEVHTLAPYLTVPQLADHFEIGHRTFWSLMKRQPEVEARYKNGRAKVIAVLAKSLVRDALNGDKISRCFYLKTQAGWRETDDKENHQVASLAESVSKLISKLPN